MEDLDDTPKVPNPGYGWIDGEARNAEHPATFEIPTLEERQALGIGDSAKIGIEGPEGGERFWILIVAKLDTGEIVGEVANELIDTEHHGIDYLDYVKVELRHIIGTL